MKAAGEAFLPRANSQQSDAEYQRYKDNVVLYPAAARTLDGLIGLIGRKPPMFLASASMETLAQAITVDGDSLEEFAEEVLREALTTNFVGLLVDFPASDGVQKTVSEARTSNERPFVAMYCAESILEVTRSVINNLAVLTRVRLQDDCETIRELVLQDGLYVQRIWSNASGTWTPGEDFTPIRNGQRMDAIPFTIINDHGRYNPTPSPLDNAVDINLNHYRSSGRKTIASYFLSAPIPWVAGITNDDANDLSVAPGSLWSFRDPDTKCGYLEFSGAGMADLRADLDRLEQYLATVGARILASDKAAAETAEALSIRRASENSVLASSTRIISRQITETLQIMADWIGDTQPVSFTLNADFLPTPMTSLEVTAMVGAWQAHAVSYDVLFDVLQRGEIIGAGVTIEDERARIEQEKADVPTMTFGE